MSMGKLYLCATPIGNLDDITLRVIRAFEEADAVWAEDTRRTLALLNHLGIKKPLVSCHEHNEQQRAQELPALLEAGQIIAYASDAGMPGISDPGAALVAACARRGLPVEVLPGASAVLTAAVLSGLDCGAFTFYGFLPREKKPRRQILEEILKSPHLSLVYESPLRLPATLKELRELLGGERQAAVLRELTKLHEEAARGTLNSLCERFTEPPRGECVIAIAGAAPEAPKEADPAALDTALREALAQGLSVKDAAARLAALYHVPKKAAYARALEIYERR